jgi:hypothetical protein
MLISGKGATGTRTFKSKSLTYRLLPLINSHRKENAMAKRKKKAKKASKKKAM